MGDPTSTCPNPAMHLTLAQPPFPATLDPTQFHSHTHSTPVCFSTWGDRDRRGGSHRLPPCNPALLCASPHQATTSGHHGTPYPHGFPCGFPMYLPTRETGTGHRGGGHREPVAAAISPYTSQPPSPHHARPPSTIPICMAAPMVPLCVSPPRETKERREGTMTAPSPL